MAQPVPMCARSSAGVRCPERLGRFDTGCLECRQDSEQDRGHHCNTDGEREHASADSNLGHPRQFSRSQDEQNLERYEGDKRRDDCPTRCQHHGLSGKLTEETEATGANRRTH